MTGTELAALITAVFTGLAALIVAVGGLIKTVAELKLLRHKIEDLSKEVGKLKDRNRKLWLYIEKLLEVIRQLSKQLRDLGIAPCVVPPDWDGSDE